MILFFFFQAKRNSIRLDIYRKFSNALAVTVIASVVWIGYEVYAHFHCFWVLGSSFVIHHKFINSLRDIILSL